MHGRTRKDRLGPSQQSLRTFKGHGDRKYSNTRTRCTYPILSSSRSWERRSAPFGVQRARPTLVHRQVNLRSVYWREFLRAKRALRTSELGKHHAVFPSITKSIGMRVTRPWAGSFHSEEMAYANVSLKAHVVRALRIEVPREIMCRSAHSTSQEPERDDTKTR
jgi:hypothetical protein